MKKILHVSLILFSLIGTMQGETNRPQQPSPGAEEVLDPIFIAAIQGDIDSLRLQLIKEKKDPNVRDSRGNTPLFYAKDLPTVKVLTEYSADINAQNNEGISPLHINVVFGRIRKIQYLLKHGAKATITDNRGVTPLHLATMISFFKDPKLAILGISATGAISIVGVGSTAALTTVVAFPTLLFTSVAGTTAVNMTLAGALTTGAVISGSIPAYLSVTLPVVLAIEAAILAIIASIDIFIRNRIVFLLLQHNADPNAKDKDGNTPLHILASGKLLKPTDRHGGRIMARHLILAGAIRDIKNHKEQTPYDLAKQYKRLPLMPLLKPAKRRPVETIFE